MTEHLLAPLHPDERALSSLFHENIDEEMLREISEADYGEKANECRPLLRQILRIGVPESNDFHLREVLELIRWGARSGGLRGSWIQLFACTALLQLAARYPNSFLTECETLAAFVSSAVALGETVGRAAAAVLAWRFLSYPPEQEDSAFLAFAILLLSAYVERREDRGPWLKQLATWVEEEESEAWRLLDNPDADGREQSAGGPARQEWLFGLTLHRQFEGLWRHSARTILVVPTLPHPREANESLRRLGALILASSRDAADAVH